MSGEAPAFLSPEPTCLGSLLACVPDQALPTPEEVPEPEVVALLRRLGARAPSLVSVGPLMQRLGEAALPTVLRVAATGDLAVRLGAGRWCRLLADQLQKGGRLAQAETACAHAAELLSRLADEHPQRHFLRAEMITIRIALAEFRRRLDRWDEALRDLEGARRLAEMLLAEHPSVKTYRRILAICLHELGRALHRAGRAAESEARLREAVQHQAGLVALAPDGRNYRADLERMQRTLHLFARPRTPSPATEEPGR
jgi:tetratricopeptide (TPR) repeat protein